MGTFFTLAANLIGSGLLSLPYVMKRASLTPGIISLLLVGFMNCIAALAIAWAAARVGANSYASLVGAVLGPRAKTAMAVVLVLYTLGSCVSYVVLLGDVLPALAVAAGADASSPFRSRSLVLVGVGAGLLAPASVMRDLSSLRYNGFASIICVGYLVVLVLSRTVSGPTHAEQTVVFAPTPGAFVGLPVTLVAFCMHYNTPKFWSEFGRGVDIDARKGTFTAIIAAVFSVAALLYSTVAISGYVLFGGGIDKDILENFDADDAAADVARVALAAIQILSFPIVFNSHRAAVLALLPVHVADAIARGGVGWVVRERGQDAAALSDVSSPLLDAAGENDAAPAKNRAGACRWCSAVAADWRHISLTFFLVAVVTTLGTIFTDLALVLGVKGALGGTLIVYVVPGLLVFTLGRDRDHDSEGFDVSAPSRAAHSSRGAAAALATAAANSDPHEQDDDGPHNRAENVTSTTPYFSASTGDRGGAGAHPSPPGSGGFGSNNDSGLVDPTRPTTPLFWMSHGGGSGSPASPSHSVAGEPAALSDGRGGDFNATLVSSGRSNNGAKNSGQVGVFSAHGLVAVVFITWGFAIMGLGMLSTFGLI
jgi:amino acid permease